jgi:hypothetical protein
MSNARDEIFNQLTSSQTSIIDFQKALAKCGTRDVEEKQIVRTQEQRWKADNLGMGDYPRATSMESVVGEESRLVTIGDPLSAKDIYQVYLYHVLQGNQSQQMQLKNFMKEKSSVFDLEEANKQAQDFLVNELAVEEKRKAFLDFSKNNPLRLSVVVRAIKTLRSDPSENKSESGQDSELRQLLETKLAEELKKALVGTAENYATRNKETITIFHTGFEARANKLRQDANGITTLDNVVEVIHNNINTPVEGTFKKLVQPSQFKDGSLNAFLLQTMTAPENRASFCVALNISDKDMPAFNDAHTEKSREEAFKKLGLLKSSDEFVPGVRVRNRFGSEE